MNLGKGRELLVLTQQELKENLHYDPLTGVFTRIKVNIKNQVKVGDIAGYLSKKGYVVIVINGKAYKAHRLAWLYQTGEMPNDMIDHENTIRCDNRFCNLRQATNRQNVQNQIKSSKNNKSEFLGVSLNKRGRYISRIGVDGKKKYLGIFNTPELASAAYLEAKRIHHPFSTI